ncbi:hypothetical protein QQ30_27030, partial [Xanthomonas phaseoli pv. phaseoli]
MAPERVGAGDAGAQPPTLMWPMCTAGICRVRAHARPPDGTWRTAVAVGLSRQFSTHDLRAC